MKRSNDPFSYAPARIIAALMLLASYAFAPGSAVAAQVSSEISVETRIQDMHANLKILPAQEEQWKLVAQVMRDNEKTIAPLVTEREKNAKSMSAMDDLKTYAEIADAHATAIKKFTTAFGTLYAGMSEMQKKDADDLFRNGLGNASKRQVTPNK